MLNMIKLLMRPCMYILPDPSTKLKIVIKIESECDNSINCSIFILVAWIGYVLRPLDFW